MMVDATVVMVENIIAISRTPRTFRTRSHIGCRQEIGRPMFFAILVVIAVFLPSSRCRGSKQLFKPLAYAVTFSMNWLDANGALPSPDALRPGLRLKKRKGPRKSDHWILQRHLCTGPQVGHRSQVITLTLAALCYLECGGRFILGQPVCADDRRRQHAWSGHYGLPASL